MKEFILTWWTCFENAILVQNLTSKFEVQIIWTKIADLNYWKVDQHRIFTRDLESRLDQKCYFEINDHVSKSNFSQLLQNSTLRFWSKFDVRYWTKIAFSKRVYHVRINSFKDFSGPKSQAPSDQNLWSKSFNLWNGF